MAFSDDNGNWQLSGYGREFVGMKLAIFKFAHTKNGKTVRFSGPKISFADIYSPDQTRQDFKDQANPNLENL